MRVIVPSMPISLVTSAVSSMKVVTGYGSRDDHNEALMVAFDGAHVFDGLEYAVGGMK